MSALLAAGAAACAAALSQPTPERRLTVAVEPATPSVEVWWMHRFRPLLAVAAGCGAWVFVGGAPGLVAFFAAALGCWRVIGRAEPESLRRRREEVEAELPVLVQLVAIGLKAGIDPLRAVTMATDALPGPASDQVAAALALHRLGVDPDRLWRRLAGIAGLEPLGRALARSSESGASVVVVIDRLGVELGRRRRADLEDRARRVGVKAAVPLGICLLPAFLLVGIVPLVGGLIGSLGL
jgi:Flp pilus assembly protein TadB